MSCPISRRALLASASALVPSARAQSLPSAAQMATDRHRPQYHFLARANWMNDPNGPVYHKGTYHMFFQWGPDHPVTPPSKRVWGHATSTDMVHWKHQPIALGIEPTGPESKGVWSGSVVIDNGVPTAVYTGGAGQHIATSDDAMLVWKRHSANPVLRSPPPGMQLSGWRDPAVWKEADGWYMLIGGGYKEKFGTALLYRSPDLRNWEYLHPLASGTIEERLRPDVTRGEDMWECPDFFPVGDKHVLIASIIGFPPNTYYTRVPYWLGTYKNRKFEVERRGETDLGWGYASRTHLDAKGRRICWSWIRERRSRDATIAAGWAGVTSLPRVLSLRPDGELGIEPASELRVLRGAHSKARRMVIRPDTKLSKDMNGDAIEIIAEFDASSTGQYGLALRCSPDGQEQYRVSYDEPSKMLVFDRSKSSLEKSAAGGSPQRRPFALAKGEGLRLQVFVDASVVEVFVNGRVCMSDRIYPSREDSLGTGLFASGGTAKLRSMDVWQMKPVSSDRLTSA
ncbi:MAG: glycoside hydrolase family 32 protein [Bryobacteraceae bacterium]|nr:glycoside hydrolase family 32 protein [Bryobacteraceae bacterium]